MKIALICYVYPPEHCPAGVMVSELATDLAARGHEVTVVTGWPNHPKGRLFEGFRRRFRRIERQGGHRVMRVGHAIGPQKRMLTRLWVYLTFAISSLFNTLTLGRQDAVLCLSTPIFGDWTALALAKLWRARSVRVIMDILPEAASHTGMIRTDSLLYRVLRRLDTANCRGYDIITTLGEGLRGQILARRIDSDRVKVTPLWLDPDRVRPLDRDNPWRREHGIDRERFVALLAGTIGYASGAQILIDVAEALTDRPDILILVVGEGPVKDEMMQLAAERRLDNIRFEPFQPAERLSEMQSAADVGLVTVRPQSGFTSVPSKMLGYMAAGRAVVVAAPEQTDVVQIVRDGDCGVVTGAQDAEALAAALAELADDRARCERLGAHAREYLLSHFSREAVVARYERLIVGSVRERESQ